MSTKKPLTTKNTLSLIWKVINFTRQLIINIVFFPLVLIGLIAFIVALSTGDEIKLDEGTALLLNLNGRIVDQKRYVDPFEATIKESQGDKSDSEVLLSDVLYVIDNASHDKRIDSIVLELSQLRGSGISKLESIGQALERFKKQGKSIFAVGNYFDQNQYLLASYADRVYLNPQGSVSLEGLGRYRLYYKSALEKLKINTHIFRVGTFKSAVEPYIRDDMSAAAKKANEVLLNDIWSNYETIISQNRQIDQNDVVLTPTDFLTALDKAEGESGQMALNTKLVDELATPEQFRLSMIEKVGKADSGTSYKNIEFSEYLSLVKPKHNIVLGDAVGIIVAKGTILNGNQPAGTIGGKSTSDLLRQARFDRQIKAVVLRVDSPGGSAFASEQIRQELLALKEAGKPVVVSMGTYAASGGYWISASSDYIFATPTTLTGSIGIFGMFNTIEDSLASIGVFSDGVGTSEWTKASSTRGISPQIKAVIQKQVDRGYHNFISLVAKEREMTLEQVDKVAQGRVWSGKKALELGLVDELGDLDKAVAKAAEFAQLKNFDTQIIQKQLTAEELIIQELFASATAYLPKSYASTSILEKTFKKWANSIERLNQFDDPKNMYMFCDTCNF
ncbi:signal peptide peptidase SppA [Parashewanella spongiae]|uniref:Signal peptide peptidase SppA n=1 Tax=Parashewanella spongiae TaxID=342950 RepID=A0A3A6U2N6_9GAMM|nr:signal peptide peptidase SppA [Parashewanella spongiae]MCL1079626.1 signal peptide peptidase SppA [Parashewanella spongiae]RJY07202.1 signal peptide peptidase SppA [Parashewanella spongiae]